MTPGLPAAGWGRNVDVAAPTTPSRLALETLDGPVPVLRVRGELDLSTAGRLCRAIQAVAGSRRLVIDLSELAFCDSTGLRALMSAVREIEVLGGKAALAVTPGGGFERLLQLTGVGEFLKTAGSPEAALQRLGAA
jgi:anti-sigma B factor antagonist